MRLFKFRKLGGADVAEKSHWHSLAELEQIHQESNNQDDGEPPLATHEQHAREAYCQCKRQLHAYLAGAAIQLPNVPGKHCDEQDGIHQGTHVERHAQRVDREKVELLTKLHEARLESVDHKHDNAKRDEQRNERTLGAGVFIAAVVVHKRDGGDAQQVEQVHTQRHAYDVSNEDEPSVAAWLVGAVFPL